MTTLKKSADALDDMEFDISCQICGQPAQFMGKGCEDDEHVAVCPACMQGAVRHFYQEVEMVTFTPTGPVLSLCPGCDLTLARGFATHYDVIDL
jgi:hypothetical protein